MGLARTIYIYIYIYIYIRCVYGIYFRDLIKYTVIYSVYIWFWQTLIICCVRHILFCALNALCSTPNSSNSRAQRAPRNYHPYSAPGCVCANTLLAFLLVARNDLPKGVTCVCQVPSLLLNVSSCAPFSLTCSHA